LTDWIESRILLSRLEFCSEEHIETKRSPDDASLPQVWLVKARSFDISGGPIEYLQWSDPDSTRQTIVLVHGGGVTTEGWVRTPDGRAGWAPLLADSGYHVVVPSWPGLSLSGKWDPSAQPSGDDVARSMAELIEQIGRPVTLVVHSMAGAFGYRLAFRRPELVRALVALAPAPPGDIQREPVVLSEDADKIVVQGNPLKWELPRGGCWIPSEGFITEKLVGASELFPVEALEEFRRQVVPIPASLLIERQNVRGRQVRLGDATLDSLPTLVLTGTHDTDHPLDADRATADWLRTRGGRVDFRPLDGALAGNGHMLMLERNSDEILAVVREWLSVNLAA
jgi:pimeloyl-ACP methyl ester carboxylesterase